MRAGRVLLAVLLAVPLSMLGAGPAHAASAVLTMDSVGGAAVGVGDTMDASLASGTFFAFCATTMASSCIFCSVASVSVTVLDNPTAPGTASSSVGTMSVAGSCSSTITGVTSVKSVLVNNLPYNKAISSTGAVTITGSTAGPIQITFGLGTLLGDITCVYRAHNNTVSGTYSNDDNSLTIVNQPFDKYSGQSTCLKAGYLTMKLGPLRANSGGLQRAVFVNQGI